MDLLTIITVLITISAIFSYFNERFVKLPGTIGVVVISVIVSILILIGGKTTNSLTNTIATLAHDIDFSKVLLDIMLGLLLFASALHFDYQKLKEQRWPVFLLSTIGVLISTSVFGGLLYFVSKVIDIHIPFIYCLLFGALISPTDPIVVSSMIKKSKIPPRLQTIISGESMFNDAIGLVLFVIILDFANHSETGFAFLQVIQLFAREVIGGIAIGLIFGYIGYRLMRSIKDYQTILLLSIALVLGISIIAQNLHASIPLAAVAAGLVVGDKFVDKAQVTNQFLSRIWKLIDEVLNTILFVMIGLQLVVMPFLYSYWLIGAFSILIILVSRLVSVSMSAIFLLRKVSFTNLTILTWAGLRGGISIAMALSLPHSRYREIILSSCYFIVIFSIIVQGLTLEKIVKKIVGKDIPVA